MKSFRFMNHYHVYFDILHGDFMGGSRIIEHFFMKIRDDKKLVKSREGFTKCLNFKTGKTRGDKYQEYKKEDDFNYKRARYELLRNMKKTGKVPKKSTLEKYNITSVWISQTSTEPAPSERRKWRLRSP